MTCGHQSADGVSVCANCGATLRSSSSGASGEVMQPPPYLNAVYQIISSIIDTFDAGGIDAAEADKRLAKYEEHFRKKAAEVRAMEIPEDLRDTFDEEYRCGLHGTEGLRDAVATLRQYLVNCDVTCRDRGLAAADSSLHLVNRAMRLNWETANVFTKSLEDMAAQQNSGDYGLGGGFALAGEMNITGF
ncbi:hypothetical protein IJT17_01805 [bacterium]|nr:hypothetical protein [bacterium]